MWQSLAAAIGRPDVVHASESSDADDRFAALDSALREWTAVRCACDVVDVMVRARVPCATCRTTAQVADDPQVRARRMIEYVDLDVPGLHDVPIGGVVMQLSRTPGIIRARPPRIGEHNDAVYCEWLGYSRADVAALAARGLI
jgi:crotonobetainyl-CoA:carnitine CoA-transferase CaiB-like acyl-CoA transferase